MTNADRPPAHRPRLGISACLLGDEVRYDGGHKRTAFLVDVLGREVDWVRVCPEVEIGMGTPRETLRLVRRDGRLHMVTTHTAIDHTDAMEAWARARVESLASERLSGYVLKKDSPSCGPEGVLVFDPSGESSRSGRGLFAEALMRRFPGLPIEDEARLADPAVRDMFLARVLEYSRRRA